MFIKLRDFILNENVKQAKSILNKLNLNPNNENDYLLIKDKLSKMPNLIGKFTKFRYVDNNSMEDINKSMEWILNNKNILNKLSKNILQYNNLEELSDDIIKLNREQKIKIFYNNLYRSMKKQVDSLNKEEKNKFNDLAFEFMNLSPEQREQFTPLKYFEKNNININDFINALESFVNKNNINDDKYKILEKVEEYKKNDKLKIPYFKNNVLVIQSEDSDVICDLGSQRWCIVYGGDSYRESYFGIDSLNTQYIIFNFNLPSSSSNSQFGVTIKPDGTTEYGGCQNKNNQSVTLDKIIEITDIPENILVPDDEKKKIKDGINEIINLYGDLEKVANEKLVLEDLLSKINKLNLKKYTLKLFKEISEKGRVINTLLILINNYIKDKNINEIIEYLKKHSKYIKNQKIFKYNDILKYIVNFYDKIDKKIELSLKFIIFYFNDNENLNFIIGNIKSLFDSYFKMNFNLYEKISNISYDDLKKSSEEININDDNLIKNIKKGIEHFLEYQLKDILADGYKDWEDYFLFYNKYQLKNDEEPYDFFINEGVYIDAFVSNIDNDEFIRDFEYIISKNNIDIEKSLLDMLVFNDYEIISNSTYNQDIIYNLFKKYDKIPLNYNSVIDLFIYNNSKSEEGYDNIIEKSFDIHKTEDGKNYVIVNDFDFFNFLFEDNIDFDTLDNLFEYTEYESYDENTLQDYYDDLDFYNIISICNMFDKNNKEVSKFINYNIIEKYKDNKDKLINTKEIDEDEKELLNKLKNNLKELIFEYNTDNDNINVIKNGVQDEINRSINNAYESAQYNELFNKLINVVVEYLGSNKIFEKDNGDKNYFEFEDGKLLFSVDFSELANSINNDYYYLYYNVGDKDLEWDDILTVIVEIDGKTKIDVDRFYPMPSIIDFNDSIRSNI